MNDAEFVRSIAHAAEIGDPIEPEDITRLRSVADHLAAHEGAKQVGWIDENDRLWSLGLRTGDVPSDRPVFA